MMRLLSAWVLVNGLLMAPAWISAAVSDGPGPAWLSLEAALIVGGVALLPRRPWTRALAWGLALGVVLAAGVGFADLVFQQSLGRPLDLSLDLYLLDAVYRLAVGNTGLLRTVVGIVGIGAVAGLCVLAVGSLLRPSADRRLGAGIAAGTLGLALLGLGVGAIGRRIAMPVGSFLAGQLALARTTRAERAAFAAELEADPRAFADLPGLLQGLRGRNVVLAYIESYGTAALADPELAEVVRPHLEAAAERLEAAGLHLVTGMLESPTLGGQSWYAHGTMLSGLWLDNQLRYELLLASERETLVDDFGRGGWRTATLMPAITTPWPEAVRIGYDDIYTAQNIPYAGPPFYWVTMPDQFTWSFLGALLEKATTPLFIEVGMVSSHAPWTPVIPLIPWDSVGDGATFEPYRMDGYPPEEVWWNVQDLRKGYAQSLSYSLDAMAEFAERFLDERTLLIVAGDHQAAPWVTGASGSRVPVHVIARDDALLQPFLEWGLRDGPLPDLAGEAPRMDEFRGWFVRAFSDPRPAVSEGQRRGAGGAAVVAGKTDAGVAHQDPPQ